MKPEILKCARTVWNYMLLGRPLPGAVDAMIVLGSRDDRVASYAATLQNQVTIAHTFVTGGVAHQGDLLAPPAWAEGSEAAHFAVVMKQAGYQNSIILEASATNTGQNAVFTAELMKANDIATPKTILIVTKPYMERRALRTFEKQWEYGSPAFFITSSGGTLDSYVSDAQPLQDVINIMVGDLERIMTYPRKGYMIPSQVPKIVKDAQELLIKHGFTKHL